MTIFMYFMRRFYVLQEVVNIQSWLQIYSMTLGILWILQPEIVTGLIYIYEPLKQSQLFSWISHMLLIFFWMLAEAAQATKNLHLHIILKGFCLLFVTALLHLGQALG